MKRRSSEVPGTAASAWIGAGGHDLAVLLSEIARAIASSGDTTRIAQTVVNQAVRVIHSDRSAIYFPSEDQRLLIPGVAIDTHDSATIDLFYAQPIPVDAQPLFGLVRDAAEPVVVQDTFVDPRTTREFFELFDTRSVISVPLRSQAGKFIGVLGFFWTRTPHLIAPHELELAAFIGDQTAIMLESAQLRDDLQRERTRLATIVGSMRDGILVYAPDGKVEFTNSLTAELLGLKTSVVGKVDTHEPSLPAHYTHYPIDFGYDRRAVFERVVRRKEAITGLWATVESQPPRVLDVSYAPVLNDDARVTGVVASFRDITDLRELERVKAAHEANLTLEAVIASTANGVVVYDNDSRIVLANPFVHELYDLQEGEIVGLTAEEFAAKIAPSFASGDELAAAVHRVKDQRGTYTEELEIVHPRRRIIRRVVNEVTTRSGARVGKVAVYHDVTRERAIDRQKDEFLSLASHELKTPLTSIKGYTQVLLNRAEHNGTPQREQRALQTIGKQVDRMTRLVGELLDMSRIDSNQLRMELAPVDLAALAERVIEQVQLAATRHDIVLTEPGPVILMGDADRLEQVLTNLLENAVKYSPDGGRIDVVVERHADEAHLVIRDSGIGIPRAQLPHLFTRFYRAQNVGSTISGLGLGLYISHEIVRRHAGTLSVTSREGHGSAFRVALPVDGGAVPTK